MIAIVWLSLAVNVCCFWSIYKLVEDQRKEALRLLDLPELEMRSRLINKAYRGLI